VKKEESNFKDAISELREENTILKENIQYLTDELEETKKGRIVKQDVNSLESSKYAERDEARFKDLLNEKKLIEQENELLASRL
jgi:dynactin complex subunit